jgi:hypothetical protein
MKMLSVLAVVPVLFLAQSASANTVTVKFTNKTAADCAVVIHDGVKNENKQGGTLKPGESGTVEFTTCPNEIEAECGGKKFKDEVTCKEIEEGKTDVSFE